MSPALKNAPSSNCCDTFSTLPATSATRLMRRRASTVPCVFTASEMAEGWARRTDTTGRKGSGVTLATGLGLPVKTTPATMSPAPVINAAAKNFRRVRRCLPELCTGVVVKMISMASKGYCRPKPTGSALSTGYTCEPLFYVCKKLTNLLESIF